MKDIIEFLTIHWPEITAGFTTVVALVTTIVNLSKSARLSKAVEEAKSKGYQVRCPKCKKTSPLGEVHFIRPDGLLDDDLDGHPDHQ